MDKELGLKVLAKTLNISDIRRLENDLEFSSVTRNRVMFKKTNDAVNRSGRYLASKIEYEIGLDVLKKYADENAIERYKDDYRNVFNPSINDFFATTFFVDIEQSPLEKTVNNLSLGDYTLVDTVYNGKTYFVAWF